jgi:hypothetical protein
MWIVSLLYFSGRGENWELLGMPVPYNVCIYMFLYLNCTHNSCLKIKWLASFLSPWPTLHHNVKICMGLLLHKTSLFPALIDKSLCKNEGGGGGCPSLNIKFVRHWQRIPYFVVHTNFLDCSNVELSHSITELKKRTWVYKKRIST